MEPGQEQAMADLRGVRRKARETSSRFAEGDLRIENQRLREMNRDLELQLASRTVQLEQLSHECRTPLQAIFGYTELLEREIHGPLNAAQRRDLQRIHQCEQRLLVLMAAILDLARLESGPTPAIHG